MCSTYCLLLRFFVFVKAMKIVFLFSVLHDIEYAYLVLMCISLNNLYIINKAGVDII